MFIGDESFTCDDDKFVFGFKSVIDCSCVKNWDSVKDDECSEQYANKICATYFAVKNAYQA